MRARLSAPSCSKTTRTRETVRQRASARRLLDAALVGVLLVPATMELSGDHTRGCPQVARPDRPRLDAEGRVRVPRATTTLNTPAALSSPGRLLEVAAPSGTILRTDRSTNRLLDRRQRRHQPSRRSRGRRITPYQPDRLRASHSRRRQPIPRHDATPTTLKFPSKSRRRRHRLPLRVRAADGGRPLLVRDDERRRRSPHDDPRPDGTGRDVRRSDGLRGRGGPRAVVRVDPIRARAASPSSRPTSPPAIGSWCARSPAKPTTCSPTPPSAWSTSGTSVDLTRAVLAGEGQAGTA